ncbi:hypothetical protein B0A48_18151 [Cryoendolithus antarcticus]|uniref:BTB domain-containing protein n=1 Tax=Cryoendolithus antarcticus TaxID=1507870 RepID=A0A1V8S9P7_9PEZI|nr:hypothetical protein B0A48_18151 [Cryoendolithus antarcticus]
MTPNNAASAAPDATHARKPSQQAPRRVAIPLPLSRPRGPKPAPTSKPSTPQGTEVSKPEAKAAEEVNGSACSREDRNGATPVEPPTATKASTPRAEVPATQGSARRPLTNGASTNESQDEPTVPSSPPQVTPGAGNSSSSPSARKPTAIRTELPPEFVPSAGAHTPHSATSSSRLNRNSQVFIPQSHFTRPSTASIVFGGVDSTTSSPAPSQSAGSEATNPSLQADAHTIQPPVYTAPSHPLESSELHSSSHPVHHQSQSSQHQEQAAVRRHLPPGLHAYANNFRYPQRDFAASGGSKIPNGHASHSQTASPTSATAKSSSGAYELRASTESNANGTTSANFESSSHYASHAPYPQPNMYRGMSAQAQPYPDYSLDIDNAQQLRDHITSQYGNPALSDCHLQIVQDIDGSRSYLDAHKLILARSPTMLQLILDSNDPAAAHLKTQVSISLPGAYVTLNALNECIKYVYGGPLMQFDWRVRQSQNHNLPPLSPDTRMQHVLRYIATSAWLQLHVPAVRGVEIATTIFTWETLPTCLTFALEGGLSPVWDAEVEGTEATTTHPTTSSTPIHDPYATELLRHVVNFTVFSIPQSLILDPSASSIPSVSDLPSPSTASALDPTPAQASKHKSNRSSDPRLSKIRFGELPLEPSQVQGRVNTAISSILLSLPFQLLRAVFDHPHLFERLGGDGTRKLANGIVKERESRRSNALDATDLSQNSLELQWEESVKKRSGGAGVRIVRKWTSEGATAVTANGIANAVT